jgi:hypothetical protein
VLALGTEAEGADCVPHVVLLSLNGDVLLRGERVGGVRLLAGCVVLSAADHAGAAVVGAVTAAPLSQGAVDVAAVLPTQGAEADQVGVLIQFVGMLLAATDAALKLVVACKAASPAVAPQAQGAKKLIEPPCEDELLTP